MIWNFLRKVNLKAWETWFKRGGEHTQNSGAIFKRLLKRLFLRRTGRKRANLIAGYVLVSDKLLISKVYPKAKGFWRIVTTLVVERWGISYRRLWEHVTHLFEYNTRYCIT